MKQEIILIGGGGHCKACIDVIEKEDRFKIAGIVDIKRSLHKKVLEYEVTASDEDLPDLVKKRAYFLITIGQIKRADNRLEKFKYLKSLGTQFPVVISPLAYVSKYAHVSEGTVIMHKAFINANVNIGKNCIINTGAIVEHGSSIGNHCHISTGSIINGECSIGKCTFIGSNSVIANNISIADNVVISAGSSVIKSIDVSGTYAGNPAKQLHRNA